MIVSKSFLYKSYLVFPLKWICENLIVDKYNLINGEFMEETKKCAHPTCSCVVENGEKYCSVSCQGSGKTMQIDCDCGHKSCSGDF